MCTENLNLHIVVNFHGAVASGIVVRTVRDGVLRRKYRHCAAALSGDVRKQLLRRCITRLVDGALSAGIIAGALKAGSATDRGVA